VPGVNTVESIPPSFAAEMLQPAMVIAQAMAMKALVPGATISGAVCAEQHPERQAMFWTPCL